MDAFELYSKGRAFLERRDVKENIDSAIQVFEEALRLDPDFALAQAGLGEAYWRKYLATRDAVWVDRAIAAGDRALVLDPYQAQVHVSLGIVYHGTGKIEGAIEEFKRAIELQPVSDDPYRWLGRCYMQKGEMDQAIACFERAIEVQPGYWDNYNALGICYYVVRPLPRRGRVSSAASSAYSRTTTRGMTSSARCTARWGYTKTRCLCTSAR